MGAAVCAWHSGFGFIEKVGVIEVGGDIEGWFMWGGLDMSWIGSRDDLVRLCLRERQGLDAMILYLIFFLAL